MPHRATRCNAAIVHATRARKEAHTRWPTFVRGKTVGSLTNTVSTSRRVFQVPREPIGMVTGSPVFAWNPVSVRTILGPSHWAIKGGQGVSWTCAGAPAPAQLTPPWCKRQQRCPPTIHRGCLCPGLPICAGLRPSRLGCINASPEGAATPSTVGAARHRAGHAVGVLQSRATRVRAGTCGTNGRESRGSQREQARVPPPLSGTQQGQGAHCTGRTVGVGGVGDLQPLLVHRGEQCEKTILGSHPACASVLKALDNFNWSARMTTCQSGFFAVTYQTNTIGC